MKIMTVFFFLFVVLILFLGYTHLTRDSHGIDGARLDSVINELNKISSLIRPFDDKSNLTPKSEQNALIQGNLC